VPLSTDTTREAVLANIEQLIKAGRSPKDAKAIAHRLVRSESAKKKSG